VSTEAPKRLQNLLKRLPASAPPAPPALTHTNDPLIAELVRSFFLWERGSRSGEQALAEAHSQLADYNELRVCLAHEFDRIAPTDDPHGSSRFLRLRSVLNDVFRREHEVSLAHLVSLPKRDARAYLDSLEGMHPFVSGRVCLLGLGAHAMPVDSRLCVRLAAERALPEELDPSSPASHADASSWLEHHVLAEDSKDAYARLEQWADAHQEASPARRARAAAGSGKSGAKQQARSGRRGSAEPTRTSRKRSAG